MSCDICWRGGLSRARPAFGAYFVNGINEQKVLHICVLVQDRRLKHGLDGSVREGRWGTGSREARGFLRGTRNQGGSFKLGDKSRDGDSDGGRVALIPLHHYWEYIFKRNALGDLFPDHCAGFICAIVGTAVEIDDDRLTRDRLMYNTRRVLP